MKRRAWHVRVQHQLHIWLYNWLTVTWGALMRLSLRVYQRDQNLMNRTR